MTNILKTESAVARRARSPSSTASCARRAPSPRSRASTTTSSSQASTIAPAAALALFASGAKHDSGCGWPARSSRHGEHAAIERGHRRELRHGAHGGDVRRLRRPPRPRLPGRAGADGHPVLHQRIRPRSSSKSKSQHVRQTSPEGLARILRAGRLLTGVYRGDSPAAHRTATCSAHIAVGIRRRLDPEPDLRGGLACRRTRTKPRSHSGARCPGVRRPIGFRGTSILAVFSQPSTVGRS